MKVRQIKETCLYVSDLEKSFQFYHNLLGLPVISRVDGRHVFFRAGESVLLCFIADVTAKEAKLPPHHGSGALHLAFEVDSQSYEHEKKKIVESGIEIIHEQTWRTGILSFYFHDPDGHVLEIVPQGMWD